MAKAGKKGGKRTNKKELTKILIELFKEKANESIPLKQLFRELGLNTHPAKMLCMDILSDLVFEEYLTETERGTFKLNNSGQVLEGTFQRKSNGRNSFLPDEGGEPVMVAERNSAHAMHGDRVKVALFAHRKRHGKEGEVIEIIERSKDTFVGTLHVEKNYAFLLTETRTLANDIFIPKERLKNGKNGDKAVVKIVEWPKAYRNPIGQVIDILGQAGENDTEMHAILAEYGLPYSYPKHVEAAAASIPNEISSQEISRRKDMRGVPTFTIDPRDAKDFDDALSIRPLKNNLWEVGVHIADVTHYVTEGSVIDKEALHRATSVYLVDRTIPMLPERLCNELCSLRPNEDKLAYSVIFTLNERAEVKDYEIIHTVIRSNHRFTYEEAQQIIETGNGTYSQEVLTLNSLAQKLREKRFAAGSINFDRVEVKFEIDEKGKPLSVYFKEAKESNQLIEEFMLLANRTVAEHVGKVTKKQKPKVLPYRIHDLPDPEKLENLRQFIVKFGYKLRTGGTKTEMGKSINKLLGDIKGKKEQTLIENISLRAMQKAKYSTQNIGHYGLGFEYYTHFTSPIRRYPDMMVHRLLTRYTDGGRSASASKYEALCEHSSAMEQLAASAERSSVKYKQVEFMSEHIGQSYDGVISSITEWGIFVEIIENKCEGMISMRNLGNDYFEFDERNYRLVGRHTQKTYNLGDTLRIKIAAANLEKKQLEFELSGKDAPTLEEERPSYTKKEKGRRKRR